MISTTNPAFEFLRKHKPVSDETETLVMKKTLGRITQSELFTVFENGISGQYGKVYSLDPQTLLSWVEAYKRGKNSSKSYMESGLVNPSVGMCHPDYPGGLDDWHKEANKCLTSFLNGVSESHFHPHVYDRMMLDGKIKINDCLKYLEKEYEEKDVTAAKQKVLRDVFLSYKSNGWTQVYFIK